MLITLSALFCSLIWLQIPLFAVHLSAQQICWLVQQQCAFFSLLPHGLFWMMLTSVFMPVYFVISLQNRSSSLPLCCAYIRTAELAGWPSSRVRSLLSCSVIVFFVMLTSLLLSRMFPHFHTDLVHLSCFHLSREPCSFYQIPHFVMPFLPCTYVLLLALFPQTFHLFSACELHCQCLFDTSLSPHPSSASLADVHMLLVALRLLERFFNRCCACGALARSPDMPPAIESIPIAGWLTSQQVPPFRFCRLLLLAISSFVASSSSIHAVN